MKQPKTRFFLDKRINKDGTQRIFADIHYGYSEIDYDAAKTEYDSDRKKYKRVVLYTECRIKPENFGKTVQKGTRTVFAFDQTIFDKFSRVNRSIKTKLELIDNAIGDVTNQFYIKKKNPTPEEFKNTLLIELGRKDNEVIKQKSVLHFLYEKIENDRSDAEMGKKNSLSPNYIKTYVSLSRMFENFEIATGKSVMFSHFNDPKFQWEFFRIIDAVYRDEIKIDNPNQNRKQVKDPTGYGVKSINKNIKLLHRVLSLGKQKGYNMTLKLDDPSLMLEDAPPEKEIYLTEDEIKKVIGTKVSDPELLNAKQYLIIASLTGLRIENMMELHSIKPKKLKSGDKSFLGIKIFIKKTKTDVIIPILNPVKSILNENDGVFPVFKESVNEHLKRLCMLLKIDSKEKRTKISFSQGKLEADEVPKYELVSTHDCRRSFITNLGLRGISQDIVLSMTHPKKSTNGNMMAVYNNATMVDKAIVFLYTLEKINSNVYF